MAEDTQQAQIEDVPEPWVPSLIWSEPSDQSGRRTKTVHNILGVLGETPDAVEGALIALGCTGPQPITQLLTKLGFRSIDCRESEISLDDIMTGERFWFTVPNNITAFWDDRQLTGEPTRD